MSRQTVNKNILYLLAWLLAFGCGGMAALIEPERVAVTETFQNTTQATWTTQTAPVKPPSCPWSCEITSSAASCGRVWTPVKKIVGGMQVKRNSWPWMAALWSNDVLVCGGTIICNAWIMTAAHCFVNNNKIDLQRPMTLYLGRYLKRGNHRSVQILNVTKDMVTIHEGYQIWERVNDIAMIRLPKPVKLRRKIRPICLPEFGRSGPKPGRRCRVAGWGDTRGIGPTNYRMKETTVPIVSSDICKFAYLFSQTEKILCAGGEKGQDTCTGDSGGPLICESQNTPGQWQVEGIMSFGFKRCGTEDFPATYTQISYYLFWIYTVIENECQRWREITGYKEDFV